MKKIILLTLITCFSYITNAQEQSHFYCHIASIELLGSGGIDDVCPNFSNEFDCKNKFKHKNGFSMCSWSAKKVNSHNSTTTSTKTNKPELCIKHQVLAVFRDTEEPARCQINSRWTASAAENAKIEPNDDGSCPDGYEPFYDSRVSNNLAGASDEYKDKMQQLTGRPLKVFKDCYATKEAALAAFKKGFVNPEKFNSAKIIDTTKELEEEDYLKKHNLLSSKNSGSHEVVPAVTNDDENDNSD